MMMIANLIGFCVGLDGIMDLLKGILGSYHGTFSLSPNLESRITICRSGFCVIIYSCTGDV